MSINFNVRSSETNPAMIEISPADVCKMSRDYKCRKVFQELEIAEAMPSLHSAANKLNELQQRTSSLTRTMQTLATIKQKDTRDKILAVCATALLVGVIATGIILTVMTGGLAGVLIAAATLLATFVLGNIYNGAYQNENGRVLFPAYYYNHEMGGSGDQNSGFHAFLAGPAIPLIQTFGRITRLNKSVHNQQADMGKQRGEIQTELDTTLPKALKFYQDNGTLLTEMIKTQLSNIEESLLVLENLPEKTPAGVQELQTKATLYKEAFEELTQMVTFCNNLSATVTAV